MQKWTTGAPRAGESSLSRLGPAERLLLWLRRTLPGPFELLKDRRHPLVRAERHRTRRWRWTGTLLCVLPPLLVLQAAPLTDQLTSQTLAGALRMLVGMLVCFWPLVMFTGAALASAMAVLAERSQDTAAQIVLTGMSKRALAAAKVLPHASPFLWGSLAALPLYMVTGASGAFLTDGVVAPTPLAVWPLRMLAAFGMPWSLSIELTTGSCAIGVFMALTDLGAVWMAAHWGAGLAVRMGSLPRVGWRLGKQLSLAALVYVGYALSSYLLFFMLMMAMTLPLSLSHHGEAAATSLTALLATGGFLSLWWIYPLADASSSALEDFAWFDWLAMDEFDPRRRESTHNWQAWKDVSARP